MCIWTNGLGHVGLKAELMVLSHLQFVQLLRLHGQLDYSFFVIAIVGPNVSEKAVADPRGKGAIPSPQAL